MSLAASAIKSFALVAVFLAASTWSSDTDSSVTPVLILLTVCLVIVVASVYRLVCRGAETVADGATMTLAAMAACALSIVGDLSSYMPLFALAAVAFLVFSWRYSVVLVRQDAGRVNGMGSVVNAFFDFAAPGVMACAIATVFLVSEYNSTHGGPAVASSTRGSIVIFANSEDSLLHNLVEARNAGYDPQYVVITTTANFAYYFTLFDQVLKSPSAIFVAAYGRLFVFPRRVLKGIYLNGDRAVPLGRIPNVPASKFGTMEARATCVPHEHAFCGPTVLNSQAFLKLSMTSKGILDPWQTNAEFITNM